MGARMIALTLADLVGILDARLVLAPGTTEETVVDGAVETNTKDLLPGGVFVALPGETTDGHRFADAAIAAGAVLLIVERELELATPVPQVVVANGVQALAALAREVVARVRSQGSLQVVGITGSNGKTTTKNLVGAILSAEAPTIAPRESFNNHVGAPISMLRIDHGTRYLVVEMGASGAGQIQHLVSIVVPDVSAVLKIGMSHVGKFGGIEATAEEKAAIVRVLPESATAILNHDDHRVAAMAGQTAATVRWFGLEGGDLRAEEIVGTATGTAFTLVAGERRLPVSLRILGEHHVMNALAALSIADELGVPFERAVAAIEQVARAERWRMEVLRPQEGVVLINDAYNANPESIAAALKTLAQITEPGQRRIAVLGEMAELGEHADEEHDRIGRLVVRLGIEQLYVVGHGARHIHNAAGLEGSWDGESVYLETHDEAYHRIREDLRPGDVVLVKSSRIAGLRHLGDRIAGIGADGAPLEPVA